MAMTPQQRREAVARINAEAERILRPLELDRQADTHEARARALACWREAHDLSTVPGYALTENRRREAEHITAAATKRRQAATLRR